MFGWFKSKEQKEKEELQRFQQWLQIKEEADLKTEQDRIKHEEELRQAAKKFKEERKQILKDSDQPWCDWLAHGKDINGQIRVELDWNVAFINYLRDECGFKGDEDVIVQKYLAALAKTQWDDGKNDALNIFPHIVESPIAKDAPEEK